jgi:hypothetical protein
MAFLFLVTRLGVTITHSESSLTGDFRTICVPNGGPEMLRCFRVTSNRVVCQSTSVTENGEIKTSGCSATLRWCYALLTDLGSDHHVPQSVFLRGRQSSQEARLGLAGRSSPARRSNGQEERVCASSDRPLPCQNTSVHT